MQKIFFSASLLALLSPVVFADTNTTTDNINDGDGGLLVTSTRLQGDAENMPANTTIIEAGEIANSTARNLPELLEMEAGVVSRSLYGSSATGTIIDIRGFGASAISNTLILLDGRRLNDVDMAAVDFSSIPLGNVERVEIIRGGAGSLYGDGAVGGVVNIITKKHGHSDFSLSFKALSGSYNTQEIDLSVSQNIGAFSYNVFANELKSDSYRDNNELRQQNLGTNFLLSLGQNEFHANFANSTQKLRLPGPRTVDPAAIGGPINELNDDPRGTNTPNDWADQAGSRYSAGYTRYFGDVAELILDFGGRNKYQEAFFDFGGGATSYRETVLSTTSATPRLRYHFGPHTGTIGYDVYNTRYESDRTAQPGNIDNPVHRLMIDQVSTAAYFHHTSVIARVLTVTAGARTQTIKLDAEDKFNPGAPDAGPFDSGAPSYSDDFQENMYDLGTRYSFNNSVSTFYNYARAVRFATVDDLYELDPSFQQTFSPLEPQTSNSHTVGFDYVMSSEDIRFKSRIAAYYMKLKNEIHFNPATFTNDNLDPTQRSGAEVDLTSKFGQSFSVKFNYTNTRSVFSEGPYRGNRVPLVPTHAAGLKVIWKASKNFTFSVSDKYIGEKRFDNDQENTFEKIPAYNVVDVKATGNFDGWILEAAVYNSFNENAYDYGAKSTFTAGRYNAYPLAGRTATFSVGKEF